MHRSAVWAVMVIGLMSLAAALAVAEQNKGAEEMVLEGGSRGEVPFPHRQHQENLEECTLCHDLFPQEEGAIERLKEEGKLEDRQVMNRQCIKCHRDKKREGAASGPTLCSTCHQRK